MPKAFPPTVRDAVREMSDTPKMEVFKRVVMEPILRMRTAMVEPLTMPAMSPTTSLQKFDTGPALLTRLKASLAPWIFRDAMALKGFLSAEATAMPIMSKTMPMSMIPKSKMNPGTRPICFKSDSEIEFRENESMKVMMVIRMIHPDLKRFLTIFMYTFPLKFI